MKVRKVKENFFASPERQLPLFNPVDISDRVKIGCVRDPDFAREKIEQLTEASLDQVRL